jgi:phospho-N-acetylmuramoyl-pentapeptide-transferase
VVFGGGVLAYGHVAGIIEPTLPLPFLKGAVLDFRELWTGAPDALGWLYPAFGLFVLVAMSNAVNLTDGLDGLAIGPVMTSAATYGVILAYVTGHAVFSQYLGIPYVAGVGELTVLAMALVGAGSVSSGTTPILPQVFMGDVGSLALGGVLGHHRRCSPSTSCCSWWWAASSCWRRSRGHLQVGSFKLTGKRVFAMAPIHHHYEKLGWSEPKIIVRFWIISVILALVALSTLKLR